MSKQGKLHLGGGKKKEKALMNFVKLQGRREEGGGLKGAFLYDRRVGED